MTAVDSLKTRRGFMFVLSSPSGAGKTTLSRQLLGSDAGVTMSVSVTTRPMRPGEIDGKDYFFVDKACFARMVEKGELLEHATVFSNSYGTPRKFVFDMLERGRDVLFDIDWQGTRQLAALCREDVVSVFILPPSLDELERRLKTRAQDSGDVVKARMARAVEEISHWGEYDYVVVNEDLGMALEQIHAILDAERLKRRRQTNLKAFVERMCEKKPSSS